MFSVQQKRDISSKIQQILRDTGHPELPEDGQEIEFSIHVKGKENWSWADIVNNSACPAPSINPHNEFQDNNAGGD